MTPNQLLKRLGAEYPRAWALAEELHCAKGQVAEWPGWCFLPMGGWYAVLSAHFDADRLDIEQIGDLSALAAAGAWRYSKGIYRFAPEMFEAVYASPPKGDLPIEILKRLPEWSVYIEVPPQMLGKYEYLGGKMAGFLAHLEKDTNTGQEELRFLVLTTDGRHVPVIIHLGSYTITEGITRAVAQARRESQAVTRDWPTAQEEHELAERQIADTFGLVALTLYVCSNEPDFVTPKPSSKGGKVKIKKGKSSLAEAPKVTFYQVGEAMAQKIREAETKERGPMAERAAPRPHLRRGHWHHYWTGPRTPQEDQKQRTLIVRFVMPALVGGKENKP